MYSAHPNPAIPYAAAPAMPALAVGDDPLGVEKPPSLSRKFVEVLVYLNVANSAFVEVTGLATLNFVSGGFLLASGAVTLLVVTSQRERLPMSWLFALLFAALANVSEVARGAMPVIGSGVSGITHWLSQLLMICYLVRNKATEKRIILFTAFLITAMIAVGGTGTGTNESERLGLTGVGSSFSNANALAYTCALFAVALLFYSLRSAKILRPLLWVLAAVLVVYLFRTVSRGGVVTLGCGLAVLLGSILLGRGVRLSGVILVGVGLVAASQLAYMLAESMSGLSERFGQESSRLAVYSWATVNDLKDCVLFGEGSAARLGSAGITPHNTFLAAHLYFGGIAAWVYLLWVIILSMRVTRMFFSGDLPMDTRMYVVAMFGMGLAPQVMSNQGQLFWAAVFATALVEKYASPYSHRRIAQRKALSSPAAPVTSAYAGQVRPVYR